MTVKKEGYRSIRDERIHLIAVLLIVLLSSSCSNSANTGQKAMGNNHTPFLLLGLDGADWKFIDPLLEKGELPNFSRLIDSGVSGPLQTLMPTQSVIIWNSIATGCLPEHHGIRGWLSGAGDQLAISSQMRRVPALWDIASSLGKKGLYVSWWTTWPVTPVKGILLSHFLLYPKTPDRMFPPGIEPRIDSLMAERREQLDREQSAAGPDQSRMVRFRQPVKNDEVLVSLTLELCRKERFDIVALYLRGSDILEHEHYHDYLPQEFDGKMKSNPDRQQWIPDYYRLADTWIGQLQDVLGSPLNIMIVSDHGMQAKKHQPKPLEKFLFNRFLQDIGLASIRNEYDLDWENTTLYQSDYYSPGPERRAKLNLIGREEHGTVEFADRERRLREITEKFRSMTVRSYSDATRISPLFLGVVPADDDRADLVFTLNCDLSPKDEILLAGGPVKIDSYLSHFLGHTSGQHDEAPPGIIICNGPAFQSDKHLSGARVIDILPTVAAVKGFPIAESWDGRILTDSLIPSLRGDKKHVTSYPMPDRPLAESSNGNDHQRPPEEVEKKLRDELRTLGYIQ